MIIYVIDDKREELARAKDAIARNGHQDGDVDYLTNQVADFNEDILRKKRHENNHGGRAQSELFEAVKEMKMVSGGIITDMMFHLTTPLNDDDQAPPSGLLVVMHALAAGVPVVVCTDASEVGGHHDQSLHWIFDGYVMPADSKDNLPFGWVEDKDWSNAVKLLEEICSKKIAGGRR